MDAGYDYLLVRSRLQQGFVRASAIFLVTLGTVLLGAAVAYYVYAYNARAGLDELNFAVAAPQTVTQAPEIVATTFVPTAPVHEAPEFALALSSAPLSLGADRADVVLEPVLPIVIEPALPMEDLPPQNVRLLSLPDVAPISQPAQPIEAAEPSPQIPASSIAAQQLYPGDVIKSTFWSNPLEYEPPSYIEASLLQGFRPVNPGEAAPAGTLGSPTRVILPSIGVDSSVRGLEIIDLGDSRAYETPKHAVGHIPETPNPGELGGVWLFGHLESPISGEGNVFYSLPKIPDLLRRGQEVYTIVENGTSAYLYRITEAFVVHQDELKMDYGYLKELQPQYAQLDPGGANIHLVACVPRFVYDSRLIVSGELVGVRS